MYDFLEFFLTKAIPENARDRSVDAANRVLENHLSGYRFVSAKLVPVADENHIRAIEEALETPLAGVKTHLGKALSLVSDRQHPDAANAIKESVSAVESLCSAIVGKRASLGEALKKLEASGVTIHKALQGTWSQLYGYTSDADGIRHALQYESGATVDDALYFLVSCSAFISLLTAKAIGAGIAIEPVR